MNDISLQRTQILNQICQEKYNFGKNVIVEAFGGWSTLVDECTNKVFYSLDDEPWCDDNTSYICTLTVRFHPNSEKVKDVYAITPDGNIFGSMPI